MGPITILSSMGILFTSIFFFISGYGLMVSLDEKKDYLKTFLSHRIPIIIVPFWISNIIYVAYKMINEGHGMETGRVLGLIFGTKLINSNGWFLIEILFLYFAFYFFFRLIKNRDVALFFLCVFSVGLLLYSKSLGHDNYLVDPYSSWFKGEWWYNATIVFPMGLLFGRFREKIFEFIKNHYRIVLVFSIVSFLISFTVEEHILRTNGYYIDSFSIGGMSPGTKTLLAQMLVNIMGTFAIVVLSVKLESKSRLFAFVGTFSMELFLIHHLFMKIISEERFENDFIRFGLVIICSCVAAFVLSKIDKTILSGVTYLVKNIRKKTIKLLAIIIVASVFLVVTKMMTGRFLTKGPESKSEVEALREASVGDEVLWGYYDTDKTLSKERLTWLVIDKDGDRYTLLCKYGIAPSTFNRSNKMVSYAESTIRSELLGKEYMSMFSDCELDYMVPDELGDYISLLSVSGADKLPVDNRMLLSTQMAISRGVNSNEMSKVKDWDYREEKASWWWLKSDDVNDKSVYAPIMSVDGEILIGKKYAYKPSGALRPVIIIEIPEQY